MHLVGYLYEGYICTWRKSCSIARLFTVTPIWDSLAISQDLPCYRHIEHYAYQ
jgi:hypothetical protein